MSENLKPVYKTGDSVASIMASNEAAASIPTPTPAPAPEPAPTPSPDPVAATPAPSPEPTPTPTPEVPVETNVSNFSFGNIDDPEPTPAPAATPAAADWKDTIKGVDRNEVLKALGVNEFAIEINDHLTNGGDAADYISAKFIDYNKISDADIVKGDLKKQYPHFTPQQVDLMFNRRYSVAEDAEPEDKEYASLQLSADAHNSRQTKIQEQQKFKIPTPVQSVNEQAALEEQRRNIEAASQWFAEHEATKSLLSSKRVALNLGDNGTFNFNVDRPELLMKAITDPSTWQKLTLNKQGEPDVAKMQKIALYAANPDQFENDLVNYGKSLALPALLKEGQNVTPGAKVIPVQGDKVDEKTAWKTQARSGTIGGR